MLLYNSSSHWWQLQQNNKIWKTQLQFVSAWWHVICVGSGVFSPPLSVYLLSASTCVHVWCKVHVQTCFLKQFKHLEFLCLFSMNSSTSSYKLDIHRTHRTHSNKNHATETMHTLVYKLLATCKCVCAFWPTTQWWPEYWGEQISFLSAFGGSDDMSGQVQILKGRNFCIS